MLGGLPCSGHHGRGSSHSHSAGAGDHQNTNGNEDGEAKDADLPKGVGREQKCALGIEEAPIPHEEPEKKHAQS